MCCNCLESPPCMHVIGITELYYRELVAGENTTMDCTISLSLIMIICIVEIIWFMHPVCLISDLIIVLI